MEDIYVEKFKDLPQGDLTAYYRFLNELGERFHASHHLVMRMAQFLVLLQVWIWEWNTMTNKNLSTREKD